MPKSKLTNNDFCRASKRLRCDVAAIKAVAEVESRKEAFYADGFPVILFERHKFRTFTKGKYSKEHPTLSGPQGNYGAPGQNQRNKFNAAFALDPDAAMKSCSWGAFQIMGFNHDLCGYRTVGAFVDAMKAGVSEQLDAFVSYVLKRGLDDELRRKDFFRFAEAYNGPNQEENRYSQKMEAACKKFEKENIDCSKVSTATPAAKQVTEHKTETDNSISAASQAAVDNQTAGEITATKQTDTATGTETVEVTKKNEQNVHDTATVEGPKPYNEVGLKDTLKSDAKTILPANGVTGFLMEAVDKAGVVPEWAVPLVVSILKVLLIVIIAASTIWVIYRIAAWFMHNWRENERIKLQSQINSDVTRKNIEFVPPTTEVK